MGSVDTWNVVDEREYAFEVGSSYGQLSNIATETETAPNPEWERCLDALLHVWQDSSGWKGGLVALPNRSAIEATIRWLWLLRSECPYSPPTSVHLEPGGGIIVQWEGKGSVGEEVITELTISNTREAERTIYRAGKIVSMEGVPFYPRRRAVAP